MPCERVYATTSDYDDWTGDRSGSELERRVLVRASRRIDRALIGARYVTDEQLMPTDPHVRQAVREATCAQVQWCRANGDPECIGTADDYTDVSVGDVKLVKRRERTGGPDGLILAPAADELLRQAGLLPIDAELRG